jgi:hypothetical protein
MDEVTMIVTPAMQAKIAEFAELVFGALPGYKIAQVSVTVTMDPDGSTDPAEKRSPVRQSISCRPRSTHSHPLGKEGR